MHRVAGTGTSEQTLCFMAIQERPILRAFSQTASIQWKSLQGEGKGVSKEFTQTSILTQPAALLCHLHRWSVRSESVGWLGTHYGHAPGSCSQSQLIQHAHLQNAISSFRRLAFSVSYFTMHSGHKKGLPGIYWLTLTYLCYAATQIFMSISLQNISSFYKLPLQNINELSCPNSALFKIEANDLINGLLCDSHRKDFHSFSSQVMPLISTFKVPHKFQSCHHPNQKCFMNTSACITVIVSALVIISPAKQADWLCRVRKRLIPLWKTEGKSKVPLDLSSTKYLINSITECWSTFFSDICLVQYFSKVIHSYWIYVELW